MRQRNPTDSPVLGRARAGIRSNIVEYWKYSGAFLAASAFNAVMLYATFDVDWLRAPLCFFGLALAIFWTCLNFSPPSIRYHAEEMSKSGDFGWDILWLWLSVVGSMGLHFAIGLSMGIAWCICIAKYVLPASLSSLASVAGLTFGILLLGCLTPAFKKALLLESGLLLECDHVLREAALTSKSKVQGIICAECGEPYYTFEPRLTRGLCKQCYGITRARAEFWFRKFGLGVVVWSLALRDITSHLLHGLWLKVAAYLALYLLSGIVWWPLLRRQDEPMWRTIACVLFVWRAP